MLFTTFATALAALYTGASAAAVPRNVHLGDFREFGVVDCHDDNLGVWTIVDDDLAGKPCQTFNGDKPKSIKMSDLYPTCTSAYTSTTCVGQHSCRRILILS